MTNRNNIPANPTVITKLDELVTLLIVQTKLNVLMWWADDIGSHRYHTYLKNGTKVSVHNSTVFINDGYVGNTCTLEPVLHSFFLQQDRQRQLNSIEQALKGLE